jgi:LacI family transcriptional regulator
MITMRDVAKKAGVSVATVSRVLNDKGYIKEDTRKKVLAAIEETNFKPNIVARSLFKKQSKTIGLIVPDITNPFFPQLARAVEDVTNKSDYTVILCNSDDDIHKERGYFEILQQKFVAGVIVVSNKLQAEDIKGINYPIVALDMQLDTSIPYVTCDNYQGARKATQHLLDCGCKKIAHIKGPNKNLNAEERYRGYKDVLNEASAFQAGLVTSASFQLESAKQATFRLLAEYPDIDGIFAGSDVMAIGVMKAAEKMGYSIPDDLMVVGFDGIQFGEMVTPELTTVAQPIYQMGTTAAMMLMDQIDGKFCETKERVYDVELIVRDSTVRRK